MSWDIDVKDEIDLIKHFGTQIGELKRKGEDATEFIEKKKKSERALNGIKTKKVWEFVERWGEDITDISDLKECLSQLSQHYLGGKHKQIAEYISSQLVVKENDVSSNVLHAKIWNKDVSDLPAYDDFKCCGFAGGERGAIFGYMASNAVELLRFDIGDKSAMAIMAETKDEKGKKVLLVDSVESASHMLSREDVAAAVANAIEDYAREKGFAEVVYSNTAGNNAPREFVAALNGYERVSDIQLRLTDDLHVYLEADIYRRKGVSGKMKELDVKI
jgi:hypothetical protein